VHLVEDPIFLFLGKILILSFSLLDNSVVGLPFLFSFSSHGKYFKYKKLRAKSNAHTFEKDILVDFQKPSKRKNGEVLVFGGNYVIASILMSTTIKNT